MIDKKKQKLSPPFLMVKRFAVRRGEKMVYDQNFKLGLNIIRGDNTTGKSTIVDLMYFALGAELTEWTTEQEKCDETLIEVLLNYHPFCLKREITDFGKSAMFIYEGQLDDALKDLPKWYRFPNARSDSTQSYSQKLFEILALPSHKTDDSKNLTMHQILRLMYVDQLSETTKLLKEEKKFDNAPLRRAIGEYLLGIDNLDAHNIRQDLIEANSRFDKTNAELRAIYRFIGSANSILREEHIDAEIARIEQEIEELQMQKEIVRSERIEKLNDDVKIRVKKISIKIEEATILLQKLRDEKNELESEIYDTSLFLHSLFQRLKALEESRLTNSEIGDLFFKYCPACLAPIKDQNKSSNCGLCKEDLSENHRYYAYIQMSNEIHFQRKESEHLLERYRDKVSEINARIPIIVRDIDCLKREYRDFVSSVDDAETMISEIDSSIGYKRGIISSLEDKREMIGEVEKLIEAKKRAQEEINRLEEHLAQIEAATKGRVEVVYSSIERIASEILHKDGGYEDVFEHVEEVLFDFSRDKMAVNGRSKFSASSMVVMKNSIRIAIYLHCINDKSSRLPRFLLLDNIEDKGMTESRSQNFQRQLVSMCDELESDYQLIFTTSMIDPDLDKSEYVVGPFYRKGEHTLNF